MYNAAAVRRPPGNARTFNLQKPKGRNPFEKNLVLINLKESGRDAEPASASFTAHAENFSRTNASRLDTEPKSGKFKSASLSKTGEAAKPSVQQAPARKEILYKLPKCKIGDGKSGPVELIIYNDDLYAMKRVLKKAIDKPKRIQHLKAEKFILMMLRQLQEDILKKRHGGPSSADDH